MINKVSAFYKSIKIIIVMIIIFIAAMYFFIKKYEFLFYGTLLWFLLCVNIIAVNLLLFDIEIFSDVVLLKRMLSYKKLNLHTLKIINIKIIRHPYFLLKTSVGNFNINYTKQNYHKILELLNTTKYSEIESFKMKVNTYIVDIDRR
jgi:hypothetical protein